jgi:hypothetical protein
MDEKFVCFFCWLRKNHVGVYSLKIGELIALINSEKRKK